ncbi:MAG: undecaprenyl-phosphate glucose phosphotransferase [Flavobacteriales bacterium]|nr:MAG: undecaprenyl-phosphate glucose phosphotransferase [Flavobacteriales bacterium]
MPNQKKRFSKLIRPLFIVIDILIIIAVTFLIGDKNYFNKPFLIFNCIFWVIAGFSTNFYEVYRFTNIYRVLRLLAIQFALFFLGYFTYFGVFMEGKMVGNQLLVFTLIVSTVTLFKLLSYFALRRYRLTGHNYRTVILVGMDLAAKKMSEIFNTRTDLGYRYLGYFSDTNQKRLKFLGNLNQIFDFVDNHTPDEIYCSSSVVESNFMNKLNQLAINQQIILKILPETDKLYRKNYIPQYYDDLLVLQVKKLPFELPANRMIKRLFDIFFSIFTCIAVLSWLVPILYIIVKLDSKGPLFFKQIREGQNGDNFICYKFRSMKINPKADEIHATKNDSRVTKVGMFLRKTSLDELPQFINVLKGEMSVVGPRPHMNKLSLEYQKEIDDYIRRLAVKPGITGLAQISGYRGEVKKRSDIRNRIRLDIFYIENWSFFLDIKIIIKTILNIFKGEEKAY